MVAIELEHLVLGMLAGGVVGFAYFGVLWLTVRRAVHANRPRSLLALSTVLRLAAALGAFYGLLQLGPPALAGGMVAFLIVRQLWLRKVGDDTQPSGSRAVPPPSRPAAQPPGGVTE